MKMWVLVVDLETSDQYGTSDTYVLGVFTDTKASEAAKAIFEDTTGRRRRTMYKTIEVPELNYAIEAKA